MTNIEKIINDAWEKRDQINQKSDKNIIDGRRNHSILFELLSDKGAGTLIRE